MILTPKTDPLWKLNEDGSQRFDPNAGQKRFLESPAEELLFSGPWGNGKTVALVLKGWFFASRYAGAHIALVRKVYADLRISTLRHFRKVLGDKLYYSGLVGGERPERFDFDNGSTIDFIGVSGENSRTDRLLGTEYSLILADECTELSESEWEMARGRLREPGVPIHQIVGACNPWSPEHFLYKRFLPDMGTNQQWRDDPCRRCGAQGTLLLPVLDEETGEVSEEPWECPACHGARTSRVLERECVVAGISDNEENHPPSYVAMKRSLTGTRAKRFREGKWVAFEGQVFQSWDPNTHLMENRQAPAGTDPEEARRKFLPPEWAPWGNLPPPDWPRVAGIDLGFENPFVCEWFAISPEEHWYRYRELYLSQVTIDEHAAHLKRIDEEELAALREASARMDSDSQKNYEDHLQMLNMVLRACDHDRGERAMLAKLDVWTTKAKKEIEAGLQTVMRIMEPNALGGAHLHVIRGVGVRLDETRAAARQPTCLEEEIPLYRWSKRSSGELVGVPKDIPVDKDNHAIDAMRYAMHSHAGRVKVAVY